jgi:hypothetical protein
MEKTHTLEAEYIPIGLSREDEKELKKESQVWKYCASLECV